jgi:hypothetical protein
VRDGFNLLVQPGTLSPANFHCRFATVGKFIRSSANDKRRETKNRRLIYFHPQEFIQSGSHRQVTTFRHFGYERVAKLQSGDKLFQSPAGASNPLKATNKTGADLHICQCPFIDFRCPYHGSRKMAYPLL